MNIKVVLAILITLLVLSTIAMIRLSTTNESINLQTTNLTQIRNSTTQNTTVQQVTRSLVDHNTEADCWVVFQGNVYDITAFLPRHPGGVNAIARYCGTTAFEEAFTAKHGTIKVAMFMKVATLIGDASLIGRVA